MLNKDKDTISWRIPVSWEMSGYINVEAETLEEAIEIACNDEGTIPLPDNGDYVDGSWRVVDEDREGIREMYNDGQPDVVDRLSYVQLQQFAYELYQKDWCQARNFDYNEVLEAWQQDREYKGSMFVCMDEFVNSEFMDEEYMKSLLSDTQFKCWKSNFPEKDIDKGDVVNTFNNNEECALAMFEYLKKAKEIEGTEYDREMILHDLNNLRGHEWLECFDRSLATKPFFDYIGGADFFEDEFAYGRAIAPDLFLKVVLCEDYPVNVTFEQVREALDKAGLQDLWDFPVEDLDEALENLSDDISLLGVGFYEDGGYFARIFEIDQDMVERFEKLLITTERGDVVLPTDIRHEDSPVDMYIVDKFRVVKTCYDNNLEVKPYSEPYEKFWDDCQDGIDLVHELVEKECEELNDGFEGAGSFQIEEGGENSYVRVCWYSLKPEEMSEAACDIEPVTEYDIHSVRFYGPDNYKAHYRDFDIVNGIRPGYEIMRNGVVLAASDTLMNALQWVDKFCLAEKLQAWIKANPEKCGKEENRRISLDAQIANSSPKTGVSLPDKTVSSVRDER